MFAGLGLTQYGAEYEGGSWSLLDGNGHASTRWWNAVGTTMNFSGGSPGFNHKIADSMRLYILNTGMLYVYT